MNADSPYAPPQSDLGASTRRGFVRHYEVDGDQLKVREGVMLPDVCLISGQEGESLSRSTQRLFLYPAWSSWMIVPVLISIVFLKFSALSLLGIILVMIFRLVGRKSVIVHYAYSRVSFVLRLVVSLGAMLGVVVGVKMSRRYFHFEQTWYLVLLAVSFGLAILIRQKTRGFRVSAIKDGWATLDHVHPRALLRLQELKQGEGRA